MNDKEEIREFIRKNYSEVALQVLHEDVAERCSCGGQQQTSKMPLLI